MWLYAVYISVVHASAFGAPAVWVAALSTPSVCFVAFTTPVVLSIQMCIMDFLIVLNGHEIKKHVETLTTLVYKHDHCTRKSLNTLIHLDEYWT